MNLQIIERNNQRVLTTAQLAESYGTNSDRISKNFSENRIRYKEGKHFIKLEGEELLHFRNSEPQLQISNMARTIYLWTEKGAWLHAKSLNTDKAWDAYEMLVDEYYKLQELASHSYMIVDPIQRAKAWIKEQEVKLALETANKQKDQLIGELKPKADYMDTILKNKGLVTITQIAKDYGMSAQEMNDLLHSLKVQFKQSGQWLLYSKFHDKGYTHSDTIAIKRSDGRPDVRMNTKWTQKGRLFIYNLLKENNVLPTVEREGVFA